MTQDEQNQLMREGLKRIAQGYVNDYRSLAATLLSQIGPIAADLSERCPQHAAAESVAQAGQFLSDVVTAAGLLSSGKTDKGLARRISTEAYKLRSTIAPVAPSEDAKDAARYRWLRDHCCISAPVKAASMSYDPPEWTDSAVDAAMKVAS